MRHPNNDTRLALGELLKLEGGSLGELLPVYAKVGILRDRPLCTASTLMSGAGTGSRVRWAWLPSRWVRWLRRERAYVEVIDEGD